MQVSDATAVAQVIQLTIAPVFLLSAIGAMLTVMTNRLGRVIDRARRVEEDILPAADGTTRPTAEVVARLELGVLVCQLVILSFLAAFISFDASLVVALLFIAAMVALSIALILFLSEVSIATSSIRFASRDGMVDLEQSGRPR